mmetsp:Transcript_7398/g.6665  ORF Transcript_7398/g.6665 Transcript_7398/m.6665 type:complete len:145 (-) Transcript_7398:327-761(-)
MPLVDRREEFNSSREQMDTEGKFLKTKSQDNSKEYSKEYSKEHAREHPGEHSLEHSIKENTPALTIINEKLAEPQYQKSLFKKQAKEERKQAMEEEFKEKENWDDNEHFETPHTPKSMSQKGPRDHPYIQNKTLNEHIEEFSPC